MLDKRTPRSQSFKNFQLQQQQQSFSTCNVLPQQLFDFALADPLYATIYELLKATLLHLAATQSPFCSTLQLAIYHFEQYAATSSVTLASAVSSSIEQQLAVQGILRPTKLNFDTLAADIAVPAISDAPSTQKLPSVSSSTTIHEDFPYLLDLSASQLEPQCYLLEQQISIGERFHSIKENLSLCDAHNLCLDDDRLRLTAVISSLESDLSRHQTASAQEQALSAAIAHFCADYQLLVSSGRRFGILEPVLLSSAYQRACANWRYKFRTIQQPSQPACSAADDDHAVEVFSKHSFIESAMLCILLSRQS